MAATQANLNIEPLTIPENDLTNEKQVSVLQLKHSNIESDKSIVTNFQKTNALVFQNSFVGGISEGTPKNEDF
tara:strand:- start:53 stop:271 length:219 start_codon:yes stop_codon:yes gene_type:complete